MISCSCLLDLSFKQNSGVSILAMSGNFKEKGKGPSCSCCNSATISYLIETQVLSAKKQNMHLSDKTQSESCVVQPVRRDFSSLPGREKLSSGSKVEDFLQLASHYPVPHLSATLAATKPSEEEQQT